MSRTLLIADDIRMNREILKKCLGADYDYLEAGDGQEALTLMARHEKLLSAVLLDLVMPVTDGFEVLRRVRLNPSLARIPVIVMTGSSEAESESKALSMGASDYIAKPYNPVIIRHRIRNIINMRETAATINSLQRDKLTGLYNREAFFERVPAKLQAHPSGYYIMASFDIDNFKVINDQYGPEEGDRIIRHIGEVVSRDMEAVDGLCSRIAADNFAALYPARQIAVGESFTSKMRSQLMAYQDMRASVTFSVGRYAVTDLTLSASAVYDRAYIAKQSVKGRYDKHVAYFDESMRDRLVRDQQMISEMDPALRAGQFEVWFQPQFNHSSGALIGAEALVRWRHPERGLISPAEFIPVFEQTGFIYEMDKYVWEQTCRLLRKWLDEGRSPLPLSVNVSRYDLFRPDLVEVIVGLVKKHGVAAGLIRLEITESAFARSTEQIVEVVKRLIHYGFTVEIDDFGSGYSSLNILKSVPAQVVKLDMRFLEGDQDSQRGGNILESIVRMTRWLGMSVIAEGVEEVKQADYLKSIGCSYVQGFLYARPMPEKEYEALANQSGREEKLLALETVENLDNNAFWDPGSIDTLIFSSYVGGACIFEFYNDGIELLRANDKFAEIVGGAHLTVEDALKLNWMALLEPDSREAIRAALRRSVETGDEVSGEYVFANIPGCPPRVYLRSTLRVIAIAGQRYLAYCTNENITAQREAEEKERGTAEQLKTIMTNVNCGITAVVLQNDGVEYLLTNDRYYEMLGYTKAQYHSEVGNAYTTIHPEDRERVVAAISLANAEQQPATLEYRFVRRDGSVGWVRSAISTTAFNGVSSPVQLCIYTDITAEKQAAQELLDNLPCGAGLYEFRGNELVVIQLNRRYKELVGREVNQSGNAPALDGIHPEDRAMLWSGMLKAMATHSDYSCDLRILRSGGGYLHFHLTARGIDKGDGVWSIYVAFTPLTDETVSVQEMLPVALRAMMAYQPNFCFVKDKKMRYVCSSRALMRLAGLTDEAEIVGKTDRDLYEKELADRYIADDRKLLQSGQPLLDAIERIPSADGKPRYAKVSKYPLYDSRGNVIGLYGTSQDITKTREAESQLTFLTNSIPGGIATYEYARDHFRIVYCNDGFGKLFGFTRDEYEKIAGEDPLGRVFKEDLLMVKEQVHALVRGASSIECVFRIHTKGGGFKWVNHKAVVADRSEEAVTINAIIMDVTELQEAMERLRISEEENRLAVLHTGNTICRYNVADQSLTLPSETNPIFSMPAKVQNVPCEPIKRGDISPETADDYMGLYRSIQKGNKTGTALFQRHSSRGWRWLEAHYTTIFADSGEPVSAVISFSDVTDRLEKEMVYKKWQQSLSEKGLESYTLFRSNISKNTSFDSREGSLLCVDFDEGQATFDDRTLEYARKCVWRDDAQRYVSFLKSDALLAAYYRGKRTHVIEYREQRKDGANRWLRLTVELVEYPNSTDVEAYMLYENIDDSKKAELLALERAESDPLTGVLNRNAFAARVNELLKAASPHARYALLMLDVDGFKTVNDVLGHGAGDRALISIAQELRSVLRRGDLLGRLGGDEFVLFLIDIPNDAAAANKARQICSFTRKSFSPEVQTSGSVGIAIAPRDGVSFDELYRKADRALYHVKDSGRDNYALYRDDMAEKYRQTDKLTLAFTDLEPAESSALEPKDPSASI